MSQALARGLLYQESEKQPERSRHMTTETAAWTRDNDGWLVRVKVGGRIQEVRCTTEGQARYIAGVLAFNPPPPPSKLRH